MGKSVRMADIAERLNISVESVSKALAGKRGVGEEMRAKVVALAKEMGYEGSKGAGEPAKTGNIAVLVANRFFMGDAFYSNLYRLLLLKSGALGLTCLMEIVLPEAERDGCLPALITGQKVEAVIFMGQFSLSYIQAVADAGLPFLFLDSWIPGYAKNTVISDNIDGGYQLTRHLLKTGRREIGFVGSVQATPSIMNRYMGYQLALLEEGLTPKKEWVLEDRDEEGLLAPVVLPSTLPQAFLCSCDEMAYYLIEQLRNAGKRVPEDVAVCGYDDVRPPAISQSPLLTTYRVNLERMAEEAVRQIQLKLQHGQTDSVLCMVAGQLIVRDST